MRVQAIVHQQIFQIKWHLLACLGLIMVLPLEDAMVSFGTGHGFRTLGLAVFAISFSPLLAGLIACANVQGDLSDKRYIFWRSKPANVKKLMALKYVVGLVASLAILACPLVFAAVSNLLCGEDPDVYALRYYVPVLVIIAVMTYSLCFACNVLVRSTARAWLIGMLLAGFVLVFPFMLPLGITDIVSDVGIWKLGVYPAIIVVVSTAAFLCALYAAQHDWHLKTNLKGLLCAAAGLVLLLLMLFSSQVANIRVLDEKVIENFQWGFGTFGRIGSRRIFQGKEYVDISRNKILLQNVGSNGASVVAPPDYWPVGTDSEGRQAVYGPRSKDLYRRDYPGTPNALYMDTAEGLHYFGITAYVSQEGEGLRRKETYEEVYLRSYKLIGNSWKVVGELDITDCLTDRRDYVRMTMRLVDRTLVACINRSFVTVDVTRPAEFKVVDKKFDVIRGGVMWLADAADRSGEFPIPLLPIEGLGMEERIRLSIDLIDRFGSANDHIYDSSIVDIHDGKIAFFSVSERDVARYDVTKWDDETIYCRFSVARPFTALEVLVGPHGYDTPGDRMFVQDQKLYLAEDQQLMVFDVRSNRRIRKVGHFARMDCNVEDVAVLEDGRLLLCARLDARPSGKNTFGQQRHLYLLERPK